MLIKLDTDTMAFASLLVSIVGAVAAIIASFYANIAASYAKKAATRRDLTQEEPNTEHVEHFSNRILSIDTPIHKQQKQEDSQAQVEQKTPPAQQESSMMAQSQQESSQVPVHEAQRVQPQQEESQAKAQAQAQRDSSVPAQRIPITVVGEALGEVPLELFLTVQDSSVRVSRVERLSASGKTRGSSPCKATDNALVFKSILAPQKVRDWWDAGESASDGEARCILRVYLLLDGSEREVYRDIAVSIVESLRNVGIATLVAWTIKGST